MLSPRILRPVICLICGIVAITQFPPLTAQQIATESPAAALKNWLSTHEFSPETLDQLQQQPFATAGLTKDDAQQVAVKLWEVRSAALKLERAKEMEERSITIGDKVMPFWFKTFGEAPATGRSLFISMHGGGGAPARVNDQQYENQKRLYQPKEGIYLVPRAPTNAWNLWHQAHIDKFFERLITNMIVFENVNPDRVYIMGYSAGGDGVYQLAPRMADRWAAAAMMAGHPNETKPNGLHNLPFTIHMGARDGAYKRNTIAGQWKTKLMELQGDNKDRYVHYVELHSGRGHWMNLEDAVAVPWMAKFDRNRFPRKVVWLQDDVVHNRFYWLQTSLEDGKGRPEIVASVKDNTVTIEETDVADITILLHDDMVDMNRPVKVQQGENVLFNDTAIRSISTIAESLLSRNDPQSVVYGKVPVTPTVTKR